MPRTINGFRLGLTFHSNSSWVMTRSMMLSLLFLLLFAVRIWQ
jgi:hypothetical protein